MRPAADYLLLKVKKNNPSSIIYIPEQYRKRETEGVVLDVGDYVGTRPVLAKCVEGTWIDKIPKKGDKVYYKSSGIKDTEWGLLVPARNVYII